jgi:acetate kinase
MEGCIAVLNAGSSSLKFALYDAANDGAALFRGQIEEIGLAPRLSATDGTGAVVAERSWGAAALDHRAAAAEILRLGPTLLRGRPVVAFGHRVVHGGTTFAAPVRIDDSVRARLAELVPLAPLHQPHSLAPIDYIATAAPHLPQVACFDTAFHRAQPALAQQFALPRELSAAGVRRYGFHGLSYDFIVWRLRELTPDFARSRLVIAHLGNGASLCGVQDGRSVATTMGFTALDGLMMGTRSGALDPGVLLYLMRERGLDAGALEDLLYRRSGLLGVSGISSDMRANPPRPRRRRPSLSSPTASCAKSARLPRPWADSMAWSSPRASASMMLRHGRQSAPAAAGSGSSSTRRATGKAMARSARTIRGFRRGSFRRTRSG